MSVTHHGVRSLDSFMLARMEVDNAASYGIVCYLIAIVHQHKEQVKARHDGGTEADVLLEIDKQYVG